VYYVDFLTAVHRRLNPKAYLEIGVAHGKSLALADCRAVGVDPGYSIVAELDGDYALVRSTSDDFFSRRDPLGYTGGRRYDLAFIDGLHLFEFALRDFMGTERFMSPGGLVVFDDMLPRSVDEAARDRHTRAWTGDVFHVMDVLRRHRPELVLLPVNTRPTGLLLICNLQPGDEVLRERYDEIVAEYRRPDPQQVPAELIDRIATVPAERLLASPVLDILARVPEGEPAPEGELRDAVARSLGRGFLSAGSPAATG
jgi:predicted O-methyltransferase YrrM